VGDWSGERRQDFEMKLPGPLSALRHRNFAIFWGAAAVSDIGTWMQLIAVGVLVARVTGKASATGLVGIAGFATTGLLAPIGGVLSDRFDRRKMLLGSLGAQTILTAIVSLQLRVERPNIGLLTALIALQGAAGAIGNPAFQSLIPALVPRDELLKAMSLLTICWNSGRIFGSLLAAALATWLSPSTVVALNAVSWVVLFAGVASARGEFRATPVSDAPRSTSFLQELRLGAHELWKAKGCRFALVSFLGIQMTIATWVGLIPIYAQKVLGDSPGLASRLTALQGAGSIFGAAIASGLVHRFGRPRSLLAGSILCALSLVGYSQATTPLVAYPFAFLLGGGALVFFVLLGALMQRDAPEFARARIMSIQQSVIGVSYGISVVGAGVLGDRIGLQPVLLLSAGIFALLIAIAVGPLRSWWSVVGAGDPPSLRWQRIVASKTP
jgi:MFS family permease